MNGHIIPKSDIAVDYWGIRGQSRKYIHFLTHTHGDHVVGLTSTWHQPIYCSEVTALLLAQRHCVSWSLLNILPLNESKIINVSESETFTVTTYDANHCPGAVMFYFEGEFGNVLYTGDFRLNKDILQICQNLSQKVDLLYLDNTFCSPDCVFPSREECLSKIVDIILSNPNCKVIIGVRKLGKETMLGQLGEIFCETVSVSLDCYKLCQAIFDSDVFTTSYVNVDARFRTVPMEKVEREVKSLNRECKAIGILPTAINTGVPSSEYSQNPTIFVVPYSDHCNYTELVKFVATLKPSEVMPIVRYGNSPSNREFKDRVNMSCFNPYLSPRHFTTTTPQLCSHVETVTNQKEYENMSPVPRKRKQRSFRTSPRKKKPSGVVYDEDSDENSGEACEPVVQVNGSGYLVDRLVNIEDGKVDSKDFMNQTTEDDKVDSQDFMKQTTENDDKVDSRDFMNQTTENGYKVYSQDFMNQTTEDGGDKADSKDFMNQTTEDDDKVDSKDFMNQTTEDDDKVDNKDFTDQTTEDDDKVDSKDFMNQTTEDDDKVDSKDFMDQTKDDGDKSDSRCVIIYHTNKVNENLDSQCINIDHRLEDDDKVESRCVIIDHTTDGDTVDSQCVIIDYTTENDDKVDKQVVIIDLTTEADDNIDSEFDDVIDLTADDNIPDNFFCHSKINASS